ncbi:MAG: hypothetical protein WC679_13870 [Bacteroidales bacterium]|jgi:Holliday junction resolvase RusA-like endonuclease
MLLPSENYRVWHEEQSWLIKSSVPVKPIERCEIEMSFYAPDKRSADLDNKAGSLLDLFRDNKIIVDDNWFVCRDLHLVFCGVDKLNPRCEVVIKEISYE